MRIGNNRTSYAVRHGRLLALCGLSLLLHVAVIALLNKRIATPLPPTGHTPLAVRLAGAAPAPPAPPVDTPATPAALSPAPAVPVLPAPTPIQATPIGAVSPPAQAMGGGIPPAGTPSRYRINVPPSATLRFEVRDAGGGAGAASIDWQTDGVDYRLAVDGVLGEIDSEGATDDAGIAPRRARYRLGAGSAAITFERARGAIVLESVGRSVQDLPGSQDGATVLMQLTGMGLADPDQLQGIVDIYVGRLDGAAVERFQVLGPETIQTALGPMETLHLARAGKAPLEVWLAPSQGWLPVQLRAGLRTQVVKEIVRAPAP